MNTTAKIQTYAAVATDSYKLDWAHRNLILADLAKNLGLKHWHDERGFTLNAKSGRELFRVFA